MQGNTKISSQVAVRAATVRDAEAIHQLINIHAEQGLMLHRSLNWVYQNLRDFVVAEHDGRLIGCCGLAVVWEDLGEVRSLAVLEKFRRRGIGSQLLAAAVAQAKMLGLKRLFALTVETAFFLKYGFQVVPKQALPHKVWDDCHSCPIRDKCNETAVMLRL